MPELIVRRGKKKHRLYQQAHKLSLKKDKFFLANRGTGFSRNKYSLQHHELQRGTLTLAVSCEKGGRGEQWDHSPFLFLLEQRNSVCVYFIVSRLICIYIRADTGLFAHAEQHITLQTTPVTSAELLGSSRNSTSSVWLQRDILGISPEKAVSPSFSSSPDITTTKYSLNSYRCLSGAKGCTSPILAAPGHLFLP